MLQNDPIVRHRLRLFAERLDTLGERFGAPDFVVLEFVREDFMGRKAKLEYFKFQRERANERARAREEAANAGAEERSAGLKMELLKAQVGECLYTGTKLIPESLDDYCIDHIVPRTKGGPDSAVNYVLTTRRANDDKGDRTPYEWLSTTSGWDAYVERVKKRIGTLRNKKVQLLTAPDAETLVQKYTAFAETAWISKLAQSIIGLRFGWPGGIANGERKVIIISGGLTGRIRRKYKLNSLLNPDATSEEEAEIKNRNDDRHHALDAMVISFIPNWARNSKFTGFFRFPDGIHRELFRKEIDEVIPQNVCFEKPVLAETIYGARTDNGKGNIVQRTELISLATKPTTPGKYLFDLKYAVKQAQSVRDATIKERVLEFLTSKPDEGAWRKFCAAFYLKRKDGSDGPRVECVTVTVGEMAEYKDMSKDGTGAWRKGLGSHKGQIIYWDQNGVLSVRPIFAHGSVGLEKRAVEALGGKAKFYGFFQSDCPVRTTSEIPPENYRLVVKNEAKQKRRIPADKPLPPCDLTLRTIVTKNFIGELTLANNTRVVASLDVWVNAGLAKAL